MKNLTFILLISLLTFSATYAQEEDNSEYRYWCFVLGVNHGFSAPENTNQTMMIHSPKGDMYKAKASGFSYVPGYQVGALYNFDLKNNKTGVVAGVEFVNYGFATKYETVDNKLYDVKQTFRATAVSVPLLFKFGTSDIYRDMKYFTIGARANYNISVMQGQKAGWESQKYGVKLTGDQINSISVAGVLGFNIGMFSCNANYMFMNFVNDGNAEFEGIKGGLYIYTSLNIPLCRWLSVHNWQAEKIRRKLHGSTY
ncbi:MAG: PorT family protein [Bacteroidales bacterium]|nr:PorT family protein [Bacteroidales bacterium]